MMGLIQNIRKSILQSKFGSRIADKGNLQSRPLPNILSKENINKKMANVGVGGISVGQKVVGGAGSIFKTVFDLGKKATSQKILNPGGWSVANKLKLGTAGAGISAASYVIYKATSKAQESNLPGVIKAGITGAGIATYPLGGIPGLLKGTGVATGTNIKDRVREIFGLGVSKIPDNWKPSTDKYQDIFKDLPTAPNINYNFTLPQGMTAPQNIYMEYPQISPIQTPSFSPSFALTGGGGGLMENLPLLLLLGAGVGGYALGRRKKRKKKKYKYRRR